jgi:hypothetical protein
MSTLTKVLAVLNVFAAIAFVALAAAAWGKRNAWSYAVFRHDLLINGLPVDDRQTNVDGVPVASLIGSQTLQEIFGGAGEPVRTQADAAQKRLESLRQGIGEDAAGRQKLARILIPLQRTRGERDAVRRQLLDPKVKTADLLGPDGPLERAFRAAVQGKDSQGKDLDAEQRRREVAHVLLNSDDQPQAMQWAIAVCGLDAYTRAADSQAQALSDMTQSVRTDLANRRADFALAHKNRVMGIELHADQLADLQGQLQHQQGLTAKHQALVTAREADVADITKQLADTRKAVQEALKKQGEMEKHLFDTQRELGTTSEMNQKLEQEIRSLELGR